LHFPATINQKLSKKIIIIGATSGIGREIANIYAAQGHQVAVTGRREHLLLELKQAWPTNILTSCFDVRGGNNQEKVQALIHELGGLDLLIYNAGIGIPSDALKWQNEKITVETNVVGFISIVSYVFNFFVQQGYGQIALTSSIAALRGSAAAPAYSASKAFMSTYAEGLSLKAFKLGKPVLVTDIRPGYVNTHLAQGDRKFWEADVGKAARQMVLAIETQKRIAYITRRWRFIAWLFKALPFTWYKRLA
jgi:short-subunit dehydrogenase